MHERVRDSLDRGRVNTTSLESTCTFGAKLAARRLLCRVPPSLNSGTRWALSLNASVNFLRFRFAMGISKRILAPAWPTRRLGSCRLRSTRRGGVVPSSPEQRPACRYSRGSPGRRNPFAPPTFTGGKATKNRRRLCRFARSGRRCTLEIPHSIHRRRSSDPRRRKGHQDAGVSRDTPQGQSSNTRTGVRSPSATGRNCKRLCRTGTRETLRDTRCWKSESRPHTRRLGNPR